MTKIPRKPQVGKQNYLTYLILFSNMRFFVMFVTAAGLCVISYYAFIYTVKQQQLQHIYILKTKQNKTIPAVNTEERSEWSLGSILMYKNINPTRQNLSPSAPNTFIHQKTKTSSSPAFANLWLLLV